MNVFASLLVLLEKFKSLRLEVIEFIAKLPKSIFSIFPLDYFIELFDHFLGLLSHLFDFTSHDRKYLLLVMFQLESNLLIN